MRTAPDSLIGMSFGLLVVKGNGEPQGTRRRQTWTVHCICGTEKPIREDALLSGRVRSCGCATNRFKKSKMEKRFSLVNKRFGRLWVVLRAGSVKSGTSSHSVWTCKCDCGKVIPVRGGLLTSGKVTSCGCEA
jgi:hypothetical protein